MRLAVLNAEIGSRPPLPGRAQLKVGLNNQALVNLLIVLQEVGSLLSSYRAPSRRTLLLLLDGQDVQVCLVFCTGD